MTSHYDKIILLRHPKQAAMAEVADADLVLLSYGWGTPWRIVKDRHGDFNGRPNLTVDQVRKLV